MIADPVIWAPVAAVGALLILAVIGGWALLRSARGEEHRRMRIRAALGAKTAAPNRRRNHARAERQRRREIETTLRDMAKRQRSRMLRQVHVTLEGQIRQAGLTWTRSTYLVVSIAAGALVALSALVIAGLSPLVALGVGVIPALLGPKVYLNHCRNQRIRTFVAELPDALDVIVRGVRSGLPLGDCMRTIATEGREPVRTEFRRLTEDVAIGLPVEDAAERLFERMPVLEVRLLGIILGIQNRSGGNLSEAVGNLSKVLRDRKRMQAKVRAVSTEATASAAIIGALPLLVTALMYLTARDYILLLFTTSIGNIALGVAGFWMLIGVLVMRNMIRFEI
jgi:tight adherence protein B